MWFCRSWKFTFRKFDLIIKHITGFDSQNFYICQNITTLQIYFCANTLKCIRTKRNNFGWFCFCLVLLASPHNFLKCLTYNFLTSINLIFFVPFIPLFFLDQWVFTKGKRTEESTYRFLRIKLQKISWRHAGLKTK